MARPIKIAVTGGAGSGKTFVCRRFKELGMNVISADTLARNAVKPDSAAREQILNCFGEKVLSGDGSLNRQMLRRMMITDADARKTLERIIHPVIQSLMAAEMVEAEKRGDPAVIVEVPLLFESGIADRFHVVIVVVADTELRIKRLMDRDKVSRTEAKALLSVQMPDGEKIKHSDFAIKNNGTSDQMKRSTDDIYEKIYQKYLKRIETA
ncbi:MAG: dephospho-CoA kinase [Deltaproteobacteria bacterium]|nr:dephospho-CoA kinase [Deltaproteobacteria bacterium]MBW2193125.1 dephospho-CoA kinase [Deltaproteobacteria bacterium]